MDEIQFELSDGFYAKAPRRAEVSIPKPKAPSVFETAPGPSELTLHLTLMRDSNPAFPAIAGVLPIVRIRIFRY